MWATESAFDARADGIRAAYPGSSSRGENSVRLAVWRVLSAEELEAAAFYRCRVIPRLNPTVARGQHR